MADGKGPKPGSLGDSYRQAQPFVDATWQFIGSVGLCVFAGYELDKWLHTTPWLLVVGSLFGFAAGMWSLFRTILTLSDKEKAARPAGSVAVPEKRTKQ